MSGLFSSATLERIRAASDIVDVIGGYLPLKRAGANFTALCPFHKEKSPSFNVNPGRQIFHCFGCHKGGDVFTFVKEYESIDFVEAVKRLADRAKIPLEMEQGGVEGQTRHLKDSLLQIHEGITQRWQNALANEASGQIGRDYLTKRGVSAEAIKLFRIGCAPELWDDTVNWAKSKGHDLAIVEKAGLILRKDGSDHYYDRFRGRLIFPICDEQGRVIGFSGRILSGDEKTAKYVNSPETPIFTKSKVFFGLDKSKRAILDAGFAIVCEGQLDLIACFMAGVQNIIAPQGTAFTADHSRILKRYVDEVVLCFDSDLAGQNAAVRSLDHLLESGMAVRVAVVPPPHDPDSYIKANGGEAFRQLIEKADGFFDYYLNRLCATNETNTDKGRLAVLQNMAEAVHKTGNSVLIDKYAQKTALRLGVSAEAVRAEFRKIGRNQKLPANDNAEEEFSASVEAERPSAQELWLLKLLLSKDDLIGWIAQQIDLNWIRHPEVRALVSQRLEAHFQGNWSGIAGFLTTCNSAGMQRLITEAVADQMKSVDLEKVLLGDRQRMDKRGVLELLRDEYIDRQVEDIKMRLTKPNIPPAELRALWDERNKLLISKRQPLSPPTT